MVKKNRDFLNSVAFFGLTGYNRLKPHIRFGYGSVTVTLSVWFGVGFGYFCVLCQFFFAFPCQFRGLNQLFGLTGYNRLSLVSPMQQG